MAGFNLPIQAIPPQLLAEMAQRAFRPPALMGGGGMGGGGGGMGGGGAAAPGFDVQGASNAAKGLGMLGAQLFNDKGGAAPGPGALPGEDRATAPQWPPPVAGAGTGGGGWFDFLSGMQMPSFGGMGGGGVSPGFIGGGSSGFGGG
jgi:hypothetical protein